MPVAITRGVSASLASCELTHLDRTPIDLELARAQHAAYEAALERAGCRIVRLPPLDDCPDAVFVEDVAVVVDDLAVVTRPGAVSRRREAEAIREPLARFRPLSAIEAPGTLDGGDVLRLGRRIYVGLSGRSNQCGIEHLRALLAPHDYEVTGVPVTGCLHLKSAVTEVAPGVILVNPEWVNAAAFVDVDVIEVDPAEPYAANGLLIDALPVASQPGGSPASCVSLESGIGDWGLGIGSEDHERGRGTFRTGPRSRVPGPTETHRSVDAARRSPHSTLIYPASFPLTRARLEAHGIRLEIVDVSELQKAEGAVTCCSLVFCD